MISVVTPAFNEADNLRPLYERLAATMAAHRFEWEWVVVDDRSTDDTFAVVRELAREDRRVRGFRLARNYGAHLALRCALHHARGDCAIGIAADLQDPPELIPELVREWKKGAKVVWAARSQRLGQRWIDLAFARAFYWIMRRFVGMENIASNGADVFLFDRQILQALDQYTESNLSLLALVSHMGFRQSMIEYVKEARASGVSGWNLAKKLKLVVDSITGFSFKPIRMMSYLGIGFALAGFLYAAVVLVNAFLGEPPAGWTTLTVIVLVMGGIQMMLLGILGEYLWRALDEARGRPPYLIEDTVNSDERSARGIRDGSSATQISL